MPNSTTVSTRRILRTLIAALSAAVAMAGLSACNRGDDKLVIYSGRNENLVRPILEDFTEETGIEISVRYGSTSDLAPTLLEEGTGTKADVFFSQDAGALAALADEGLLGPLPDEVIEQVPETYRDPDGRWVGVTGRARVIAYNTEELSEEEVPDSIFELTEPQWKGRVGFPPTNASFVGFVSALIEEVGEERTREWLEGLEANEAKHYDNNIRTMEAVASGEISVGLVNHYYLYNHFKQQGKDVPLANHYPGQEDGGEGTFVNVAGAGIIDGTDKREDAIAFVEFLLSRQAQEFFRDETTEYPLAAGVEAIPELPPVSSLKTIDVPLSQLGRDLDASLELLKEVGLT